MSAADQVAPRRPPWRLLKQLDGHGDFATAAAASLHSVVFGLFTGGSGVTRSEVCRLEKKLSSKAQQDQLVPCPLSAGTFALECVRHSNVNRLAAPLFEFAFGSIDRDFDKVPVDVTAVV